MSSLKNTPMELSQMEGEAKEKARKQVANLLQRADQLEKVEQIRKRVQRKKATVEAMLKTAVQSQLDGVRTGMNQLQNALEDIREIKQSLDEVDESYRSISHLGDQLKKVREENSRHSQLAAAVENLKHIFNVPETAKKTEDLITEGKLLYAHKNLAELQLARDDLLFELHKQTTQSPTDKHTVMHYFSDVERLSELLGKQLWLILQRALITVRREPTVIVTVLRIIEREEKLDSMMMKRNEQTGFLPPNRPRKWREKCFSVLEEAVQARIEGNQVEDRSMNKMWLVRHLEVTRQLVLDDLKVVKKLCSSCFPPYYNIVDRYVEMYHMAISQHLNEMVQQGLEGNEIVSLLTWIHSYSSKELMGHSDLNINVLDLLPLLEKKVIGQLQKQYLDTLCGNFQEWMQNSLRSDIKDWYRDTEPDADDKGFFNTALPVILFQMIEENLQVASIINDELVISVLNMCADEVISFSRTYKAELQNYKERHQQNRSEPQFFLHYMIANINNCQTFGDFTSMMRSRYSQTDMDKLLEKSNQFTNVFQTFNKLAAEICEFLLEEVFMDLDSHLQELLTKKWMSSSNAVDTICITVEDYCQDFVHLKDCYYLMLLEKAQHKVITDYLKALFNRRVVFRSYEERLPAAEKICREAEMLKNLFNKMAGKSQENCPFDSLPMLAEVLKLKDTSMMSLELSGLVSRYPDMRSDQMINLLLMRGDVGRNEAKQMVVEVMGEDAEQKSKPQGIFSFVLQS